jgi:uncharacterized protein
MKQQSPPHHLDVKAFAQSAGELAGQDLLSKYERLMAESRELGADRVLDWSARGEFRVTESGAGQVWLHLRIALSLPLTCQRCLGPVDVLVDVDRSFRFVEGEEAAEQEDDASEEDVLALSREFDLLALMEDEVLMSLPAVPRHDTCPVEVKLAAEDAGFSAALTEKTNPFAALAKLRGGKSD